jgi:uncharacterized protein (DUF1501 family)
MSSHRACDDFERTALTRRGFVRSSATAGLALYGAGLLPWDEILSAATAEAAAAPAAPVLVSVFLPGGCDLLDAFPPRSQHGRYADLRRTTMAAHAPKLADGRLAHHPALGRGVGGGIAGLFRRRRIALLPGIDYAHPDLSHFHSRHFWETGVISPEVGPGWIGRWLDRNGSGVNPLQAVSFGPELSPVLRSAAAPVASVPLKDGLGLWWNGSYGSAIGDADDAWRRLSALPGANPAQVAARRAAGLAIEVADRLEPYASGRDLATPAVAPYPHSALGTELRTLAAMIDRPLGLRVAAVASGDDFDTHDNQVSDLARNLGDLSESLSAFQADLERRGVADRVVTLVWSEFGRRPRANESGGTDHGAGGIAWLQGTRVRPGVLSEYPSLRRLDRNGNLRVSLDFRRVYASLVEQWLQTSAEAVLPLAGRVGRIRLIR